MSQGHALVEICVNRFLTWLENWVFGLKLSEYHTGYQALQKHGARVD
jgi:hypothetical protein